MGLRYRTSDKLLGTVTLVRYNGPHGEESKAADGHYAKPHIHRITAAEIESGSTQPAEKHREITDRYSTLEQAIEVFFGDIRAGGYQKYFPQFQQGVLLNGAG